MSVPKSERGKSPFQVLETAIKLRTELYNFGERRFGYKFKERKWETEEQRENRRMYEERFIAGEQETILTLTRKLGLAIAMFNSIYAVIDEEWTERRIWQDRAIGVCADIMQELSP